MITFPLVVEGAQLMEFGHHDLPSYLSRPNALWKPTVNVATFHRANPILQMADRHGQHVAYLAACCQAASSARSAHRPGLEL